MSQQEKILVVNVNWLGDVIFSIPVFKSLRKNYPQASISCLAVPRVKEILECVPGIDEIIIYDEKERGRGPFAKIGLVRRLQQKNFDKVFLLHGSWSRALLMFLAGIPVRVGYQKEGRSRFLTHPVDPAGEGVHKADTYLNIVESFGVPVWDRTSELRVPDNARQEIVIILGENGIQDNERFVVVHTSGNWDLKRWPQKSWAELVKTLVTELKIKVVISEGPKELEWAKEVARLSQVDPLVLAGKTNLPQLMALLEKASLVISADSGPLHIASCVSRNVIGIYGPTMPLTTGPRGKANVQIFHKDVGCNRASCYHLACPDNDCMQAVTVNDVAEAAKNILSR
ncbi:MAG: lipopolysaccharide heptosyltransferase II [Candidatus Omnitrophica bacterium]|nr:lipopolysaccharide heptosyltransferase II [Candidatus Omnitrophota bacterium]